MQVRQVAWAPQARYVFVLSLGADSVVDGPKKSGFWRLSGQTTAYPLSGVGEEAREIRVGQIEKGYCSMHLINKRPVLVSTEPRFSFQR